MDGGKLCGRVWIARGTQAGEVVGRGRWVVRRWADGGEAYRIEIAEVRHHGQVEAATARVCVLARSLRLPLLPLELCMA